MGETCKPVKKGKAKAKAKGGGKGEKGKAEPKAKAKAKAKVKAEPKAKAKAKAKARKPPGAFKVCVCGGAGGIGQPLSMFMALDPNVKELSVFDLNIAMVPPAGMPRKPGQTRDDLFKVNADIAKGLVEACAKHCPEAMLALIVNPVNSIVPAMAELYKKKGLDPMKIVGVTTLDCVRASKFVGQITGK